MVHKRLILFVVCFLAVAVRATVYTVGPGNAYAAIADVSNQLGPGDTVEVAGNTTYSSGISLDRSGTSDNWIVVRGIHEGGDTRPLVAGNDNYGIEITGDYVVLEGFEVDDMPKGVGVFGDNIIVRDCIIHDCNHGLIGFGNGTGNVTVEYCEFYGNGVSTGGATQHQIYMATDEHSHPGSVFRLQFCYLHDAVEGDNVKSRAERNEIYYNWVENSGSVGHGLGLFAPDPEDNSSVQIATAREDADVVGNVIVQARNSCARIGGDAPGYPTNGRYRFVNNTFILTGTRGDAIRTFNTVGTLEMYNNVVWAEESGADVRILNDADGLWTTSPRSVTGSHNWIVEGATRIPSATEWANTLQGSTSPFSDAGAFDFLPIESGALVDGAAASTPTIAAYPFVSPLFPPAYHAPLRTLIAPGSEGARPVDGAIDIGALERSGSGVVGYTVDRTYHPRVQGARGATAMFTLSGRSMPGRGQNASGTLLRRTTHLNGVDLRAESRVK